MRVPVRCLGIAVASAVLWGQTAPPLSFEVVSVKRNLAGYGPSTRMMETMGGFNLTSVPLRWVIRRAYEIQTFQVLGPDWLDTEGYDITAKCAPPANVRKRNAMLQTLLAERFKLVVHRETRDVPAYLLVVSKHGPKLQETDQPPGGFQMRMNGPIRHIEGKSTLAALVVFLSEQLRLPVVDHTERGGTFEIVLDWTLDAVAQDQLQSNALLCEAVESQLGLKLDLKKTTMDMVVIDHVERVPTQN